MRALSCKKRGEFESLDLPNPTPADGLSMEQIATVECLAIGAHAGSRAAVSPGEWVAVMDAPRTVAMSISPPLSPIAASSMS